VPYQTGSFIERLLVTLAVWMLLAFLYRRARRHAIRPGSELARKENSAIVLYLPSFDDDTIKVRTRGTILSFPCELGVRHALLRGTFIYEAPRVIAQPETGKVMAEYRFPLVVSGTVGQSVSGVV